VSKVRIGEFAKKHRITQDTIRYYLDMGLLVSEKKGGQYKFTKADSEDMERIIELKSLDFSLIEIQKILTFQRLSGSNTDVFRNLYLPFLKNKKEEVEKELIKYNRMNEFLGEKINEIKMSEVKKSQRLGLPIISLSLLRCPNCKSALKISDGNIEESMIMHASIRCNCGYNAIIEDGVYIDQTAIRPKLIDGKKIPTKEEFLSTSSHQYVNFLYKGMATLIEYINKYTKDSKYIMELGNCVGLFLLQFIKDLPHDSTYILIDYDKERMLSLKRNLEMYYDHKNFLFLCCDYNKLPIAQSSIDILVDFGMSKDYLKSDLKFLLDIIIPLVREDGIVTGSYQYSNEEQSEKPNIKKKAEENFSRNIILEKLNLMEIEVLDHLELGLVFKEGNCENTQKVKEAYQLNYIGRNQRRSNG